MVLSVHEKKFTLPRSWGHHARIPPIMAFLPRAPLLILPLCILIGWSLPACGGDTFSNGSGTGGGGVSASGASTGSGGHDGSGGVEGTGGSATGGANATGGGSSVDGSCDNTSQCTLASRTCCDVCGEAELSDFQALNVDQLDAHEAELCGDAIPMCPGCPSLPRNPNFFATCDQGTCAAHDLRTHQAARCTQDDDCTIAPAACCDCNASNEPNDVVAIHRENLDLFREAQCATATTTVCGKCAWLPPEKLSASCVDQYCTVTGLSD